MNLIAETATDAPPTGLARPVAAGHGGRLRTRLADLILPPRCIACRAAVMAQGFLCRACWEAVGFITAPACACCGLPFEIDPGGEGLCSGCLAEPPAFDRARAAMRYDDGCRSLILAFKHGDRTEAAPGLANLLLRGSADLVAAADVVAPVPLHPRRLRQRRYNQSALLSRALAARTGRVHAPLLLDRVRDTATQGRLSRAARRRNLAGAIEVAGAACTWLAGRRVLVVDDVMTTGATANACARALKRAGAASVDIAVLARSVTRAE